MDQPDRIFLSAHERLADIGAFQSEHGQPQRLRFDLEVELAAPVTLAADEVDRILSYDVLVEAVDAGLADRRYNLLETLAEEIARHVLQNPRAARIEVRISKLDRVPGALGIAITRRRAQMIDRIDVARGNAAARVVVDFGGLRTVPDGAVIVPDLAGETSQQGGAASISPAARRIALLAADQAAWRLGGALGLEVVDSRTELTDAIKNKRSVVWAPARMMASEGPDAVASLDLAAALARILGTDRLELAAAPDAALPDAASWPDLRLERLK